MHAACHTPVAQQATLDIHRFPDGNAALPKSPFKGADEAVALIAGIDGAACFYKSMQARKDRSGRLWQDVYLTPAPGTGQMVYIEFSPVIYAAPRSGISPKASADRNQLQATGYQGQVMNNEEFIELFKGTDIAVIEAGQCASCGAGSSSEGRHRRATQTASPSTGDVPEGGQSIDRRRAQCVLPLRKRASNSAASGDSSPGSVGQAPRTRR